MIDYGDEAWRRGESAEGFEQLFFPLQIPFSKEDILSTPTFLRYMTGVRTDRDPDSHRATLCTQPFARRFLLVVHTATQTYTQHKHILRSPDPSWPRHRSESLKPFAGTARSSHNLLAEMSTRSLWQEPAWTTQWPRQEGAVLGSIMGYEDRLTESLYTLNLPASLHRRETFLSAYLPAFLEPSANVGKANEPPRILY